MLAFSDYGVWKGKRFPGKSLAVWSNGTQFMEGPYGDQAEALVVCPGDSYQEKNYGYGYYKRCLKKKVTKVHNRQLRQKRRFKTLFRFFYTVIVCIILAGCLSNPISTR